MEQNRKKELLGLFGNPIINFGNNSLVFTRQSLEDANEIETFESLKLIEEWKSLVWMNEIYGCFSLNDMQRISLIEAEIDTRKDINKEELKLWYKEQEKKFKENDNQTVGV